MSQKISEGEFVILGVDLGVVDEISSRSAIIDFPPIDSHVNFSRRGSPYLKKNGENFCRRIELKFCTWAGNRLLITNMASKFLFEVPLG